MTRGREMLRSECRLAARVFPCYNDCIRGERRILVKAGIHPDYHEVTVSCACGYAFQTRSTIKGDRIRLEICSHCHPFFTGKMKFIDTAGRIERFQRKYAKSAAQQQAAKKPASKPVPAKK